MSHFTREPSKAAAYLAFKALFAADPRISLEANAGRAPAVVDVALQLRSEAAAALSARQTDDARRQRAIDLLLQSGR